MPELYRRAALLNVIEGTTHQMARTGCFSSMAVEAEPTRRHPAAPGQLHAGPLFEAASASFYNLQLADTNQSEHETLRLTEPLNVVRG